MQDLDQLGSRGVVFTAPTAAMTQWPLFGASVTGVVDFNGDGLSDIAIGAPNADAGASRIISGKVYLFFGQR